MNKKLMITLSAMTALTVCVAALMIGCGAEKQDPTGPSNTQTTGAAQTDGSAGTTHIPTETTGNTAADPTLEIYEQTGGGVVQIPVVGEEGNIEIVLPSDTPNTSGQGTVVNPTPSTGVSTQEPTNPDTGSQQTPPSTTGPQTSAPSQPTNPAIKYPTMKEYEDMTVEDQKYFREVTLGGDLEAFLAWVTKARQEEQDGEHFEITDGTVDISDYLEKP